MFTQKNILNFCVNTGDKLLCFYTNADFEISGFVFFSRAFSFAWTRPENVKTNVLCLHFIQVDDILGKSRYLTGNRLTEADIRLFTSLVRFDAVYVGHFKVNSYNRWLWNKWWNRVAYYKNDKIVCCNFYKQSKLRLFWKIEFYQQLK